MSVRLSFTPSIQSKCASNCKLTIWKNIVIVNKRIYISFKTRCYCFYNRFWMLCRARRIRRYSVVDGAPKKTSVVTYHSPKKSSKKTLPSAIPCQSITSNPISSHAIHSHPIQSHPIPSHSIQSHPIPSIYIQSNLILCHSHPIQSHLIPFIYILSSLISLFYSSPSLSIE